MADFKEIIYNNYVSNHNQVLYGDSSLAKIAKRFPALKYYFQKHLPVDKNAHILDIGCGDGNFIYWLQQLGYTNVQGIDLSEEQVERGRKMGIEGITCIGLKEFLTQNTIKYDLIIARDVIEHFERNEVFEILMLVHKNLGPSGKFMMQVPNGQGIFYTSIFYGDYTHEMAYTRSSVNQVALNTGYSGSACYPVGPAPVDMISGIRYILWQMKVLQLKFWKMVETGSPKGIFTQNLVAILYK